MKLNVYSIYDQAAKAFMQPFFCQTDGIAVRMFSDNVNAPEKNIINSHPDQFTLYKIAEFDDSAGQIEPIDAVSLGNAIQFKQTVGVDIESRVSDLEQKVNGDNEQ